MTDLATTELKMGSVLGLKDAEIIALTFRNKLMMTNNISKEGINLIENLVAKFHEEASKRDAEIENPFESEPRPE